MTIAKRFVSALGLCALAFTTWTGTASAAPVQWTIASGGNDHWYELVMSGQSTFGNALAAATTHSHAGLTGYLATITSAGEQRFLDGALMATGYVTAWLGGSDAASEGNWEWVSEPGGPVAFTYTNWAPGEPNNCCGGEHGLLGWWGANQWNDIYDGYAPYGYVVEYGTTRAPTVPLPASGLLLLAGAGAFGLLRRKRG